MKQYYINKYYLIELLRQAMEEYIEFYNTKRLQEDIIYIDKKGRIKWQLTQSKMKSYL